MKVKDYETDPAWLKLAQRCAMGDIAAMMELSRWYRGKLSAAFLNFEEEWERDSEGCWGDEQRNYLEENPEEAFYMGASNMWLIRAKLFGNAEAAELLSRHPLYGRNSYPGHNYRYLDANIFVPGRDIAVKAEGIELRRMGLLEFQKDGIYLIRSTNHQGIFYVTMDAGYDGPDMTGFGMEELFDVYCFDEFFHCLAYRPRCSMWGFHQTRELLHKMCSDEEQARKKEREIYWQQHGRDAGAEKYHTTAIQRKGILVENGVLAEYFEGVEKHMNIPEGVTYINDGVLAGCASLSSVSIPEGVTCIGNRAFMDCENLKAAKFPQSLKRIGDYAFANCRLQEVVLSEGVHTIGKQAFERCYSLKKILLPASVVKIAEDAFERRNHSLQIWGEPGTYAEKYARKHMRHFYSTTDNS